MLLPPLVPETNKELLLILIRNQYEDNKNHIYNFAVITVGCQCICART